MASNFFFKLNQDDLNETYTDQTLINWTDPHQDSFKPIDLDWDQSDSVQTTHLDIFTYLLIY